MNDHSTKALRESWPSLYRRMRDFQCGDGWYALLNKMSRHLLATLHKLDREEGSFTTTIATNSPRVSWVDKFDIFQVKEKFGHLRVYPYFESHPDLNDVIQEAVDASQVTCEECGGTGCLRSTDRGWLKTLCDEHGKEMRIVEPEEGWTSKPFKRK